MRKGKIYPLNTEFQRIPRRDKKVFLSDQCKEIEKNSRMGKTRDIIKKIRDTKGTFHAKMGTIKDTNGMDIMFSQSSTYLWVKAQHEGALPPPCIVRKDPRVPHTARRGA